MKCVLRQSGFLQYIKLSIISMYTLCECRGSYKRGADIYGFATCQRRPAALVVVYPSNDQINTLCVSQWVFVYVCVCLCVCVYYS